MKTKVQPVSVSFEIPRLRIIALSLLALLALHTVVGCKNQPGLTAAINPTGVYTLVSVDGNSVPCNATHRKTVMTVRSGVFTINPDGTCRSKIIFAIPPNPDVSREVKATYTQNDGELTMRWERAGVTKGQINGDHFTMTNEGTVFSYRK